MSNNTAPPIPPTLGEALKYWLKLGFISFGGPSGQYGHWNPNRQEPSASNCVGTKNVPTLPGSNAPYSIAGAGA